MDIYQIIIIVLILIIVLVLLFKSFVVIRPTHRGLVERFGRYRRIFGQGFHLIVPIADRVIRVNITEQLVTAEPQQIITKDKLNATVDAQIYFKVNDDEASVKASQYNVFNYTIQIVQLARTTLRNIIGTLTLTEANSQRDRINLELMNTLANETMNWGLKVVRTELKEIDPPKDVQQTMNEVVKAENTKIAAIDFATARETEADGMRRAAIKKAEGERAAAILSAEGLKQAKILTAEGDAQAIKLVNLAAQQYFVGPAQDLRKIQATETAFSTGVMKLVVPEGVPLVNVLSEAAGVTPVVLKPETMEKKKPEEKKSE